MLGPVSTEMADGHRNLSAWQSISGTGTDDVVLAITREKMVSSL